MSARRRPRAAAGAWLAELVVRRPRATLLWAALVALAALPSALRIRLDANLVTLLPRGSPAADAFSRFAEAFGAEQVLVVLLESDDGERLVAAADSAAALLRDPAGAFPRDVAEVRHRVAPATAQLLRDHALELLDEDELAEVERRTTPAGLAAQARRLRGMLAAPGGSALAPLLAADPLELLSLAGARLRGGMPVDTTSGYYRSPDGRALLLFVRPTFSPFDIERDRALLGALRGALSAAIPCAHEVGAAQPECAGGKPVAFGFTGPYAFALAYRDWLHHDTQLSTVIALIAVLVFFAVLLGAVRALPAVAPPLFYGLFLTGAAAGAVYGRVNAVSLAFGTILIAVGIDLPIQIYNRLREELARLPPGAARASVERSIEATMARLAGPALLATLGPAVVFFACALSRYRGLAELGVLAGIGLLLNLAAMLTVLPALLVLLPLRAWMPRRAPPTSGRLFAHLGGLATTRPRAVLIGVALATAALAPLALRLRIDRRLIAIEPPAMAPALVRHAIERRFGGRDHLVVVLSTGRTAEEARRKSDRWRARAERLRLQGTLVAYESVSSLFPSQAEHDRRRAWLARIATPAVAAGLRSALDEVGFDVAPFSPFLDRLATASALPTLTPDGVGPELSFLFHAHVKELRGEHLVTTFLYPPAGDAAVAAVVAALAEQVRAAPADGVLTGEPLLEEALHGVVRRDVVLVSEVSVAAVVALLALYYRRLRPALAVLLPLVVAWTLFAAALGGLGIPLNLFNLLTLPLVVGYGIDDHVFLVHRFEEDPAAGPGPALASTGRAMVVTSLSTMAGFAGLAAARFDGLRLLGMAGALAVAFCLVAALAVLPALLCVLYREHGGAAPGVAPAAPAGEAPTG